MAYIQPQLRIFQEFEAALTAGLTPLYACIVGPQFGIHTGSDCGSLGEYDRTLSTTYSWPDKSAGSTVEQDTVVVEMNDAVLRYYQGGAFAVPTGEDAGSNKIRAAGLVLQTANSYDRSTIFGTRDVAIGDKVSVVWGSSSVDTQVAGFEAETITTVDTADAASSNQSATSAIAPAVDSQTLADHELVVSAGGTYDGLAEGVVSETYTITVTKAGGSGVAEAAVVSTTGTDDAAVTVVNYVSTLLGSRGVTYSLTDTGSSSSSNSSSSLSSSSSQSSSDSSSESYSSSSESLSSDSTISDSSSSQSLSSNSSSSQSSSSDSSSSQSSSSTSSANSSSSSSSVTTSSSSENDYEDLVVGDTWTISAQQTYVVPTPTSGGTYAGAEDTTYIIKIVTGGVVGTDTIIYNVITDNGYDIQSNTAVTAAGDIIIGNYGVTLTLTAAEQYAGGDVWSIDVLESDEGAVRTILLADKLVDGVVEADDTDVLAVSISLVDDVECPEVYYTTAASSITILPSVKITGTYLGTSQQFTALEADLCIDYRELLITNTTSIGSIDTISDVVTTLGPVSTSNPLAKAVYAALLNANGTTVYYVGVATDDFSGYSTALDLLTTNDVIYSLVPLNKTTTVINLFEGHVDEQSSAIRNNWRIAWVNSNTEQSTEIYAEDSLGADIEATVTDPDGGTNYVHVFSEDALFVTNGCLAGDILRINYRPYAGETIYDTAVVDSVDNEEELTLVAALSENYPVAVKIEIYRTQNLTQYAASIGQAAGNISDRRMFYVWPDELSDGTATVSGIYLCAALAGLRSGTAPHAPLTNVEITGFYNPTRSTMFNATQLNTMAGNGVWIVTMDLSGTVYTRHQVSTDNTDINRREQTITTNLDSISRQFRDGFSDIIGRGNVSDDMIEIIRARVHSTAESIQGLPYSLTLGPQLQDYEITQLEIDSVLKDHIRLTIIPVLPYPLNNLDITMLIS